MERAQEMLDARNNLWNYGPYLGRVKDFISAYEKYAPELLDRLGRRYRARCAISDLRGWQMNLLAWHLRHL